MRKTVGEYSFLLTRGSSFGKRFYTVRLVRDGVETPIGVFDEQPNDTALIALARTTSPATVAAVESAPFTGEFQ